ncbi:hypothetical protein ACFP3I_24330 [Chryseobacterium arachidis]
MEPEVILKHTILHTLNFYHPTFSKNINVQKTVQSLSGFYFKINFQP